VLPRGEIKLAGAISRLPNVVGRTWEYWSARVPGAASPKRRSKPATPAARRKVRRRR